ncbi:MAG: RIP metalloprotease RseP [Acidobacteria bacterium]|nr:RIP metalloprotease RseP [Acidobacteriota bacterium]
MPTIIITFVFVIGVLVFIHEAGHFSIAKLFKVQVETFSLGFGPRLFGFRKGGTDYRVSAIPLGGYVKMLGENPDEIEEARGLQEALISKPAWQRFLIFIAGPAANLVLAVLIPAAIFLVSYEVLAYKTEPARVGFVAINSPAAKAGIEKGDLIVRFDGINNPTWADVEDVTALKPSQRLPVTVGRGGQRLDFALELDSRIRSGEKMGVSGLLPDLPGGGVTLGEVEKGSPAEQAGLKSGDTIIEIEGIPIKNIYELQAVLGSNVDRPLNFTIRRGNGTIQRVIKPFFDEARGVGRIGFSPNPPYVPPTIKTRLGPLEAIKASVDSNLHNLWMMKEAFGAVISGQRAMRDTFAGPVGIAVISGEVAQQGVLPLLMMMALLSLSLGIFNLLPIPILDGGQVFMLFLEEGFRWFGGELSVALREKIQTIGFVVIVLLMGYIIYADIAKLVQ